MKIDLVQLAIGAAVGYIVAKHLQSGGGNVNGLRWPSTCNNCCPPWPNNGDAIPFSYRWGKMNDSSRLSRLTI